MPAGVTDLATIIASCKFQSDNVNQTFISDDEWTSYINSAYQELYGKIVQHFGNDYFVQAPSTGYTFLTDGQSQFFALPEDFFKLLGVDLQLTSQNQWVSLKTFAFADRNRYSLYNGGIPAAGSLIRIFYVPRLTLPVSPEDVIDGVNGWEDWIVAKACLYALAKEESDVSVFMARLAAIDDRLASEIENRDAGQGGTIVDTLGRRALGMQYRLNGNKLWLIGGATPGWAPYGDWGPYDDSYWGS